MTMFMTLSAIVALVLGGTSAADRSPARRIRAASRRQRSRALVRR
jgi:hypothetical protein